MKKWLLLPLLIMLGQSVFGQVPVADFTTTTITGCVPLAVTFQDRSSNSPTSWNWDFGNGQLSNQQNPTIVYSQPGTYSVTLVVRNSNGTNGITKTNYIVVNRSPTIDFSANITTGCLPTTIQFTDNSDGQGGVITNWLWNFGDGTTSTDKNPQKTYTAVGFYTVILRVTSSTGCDNAAGRGNYIRIVPGVTAEFNNSKPITCRAPFLVNFANQTSGPGNLTYTWDFGNSTSSTDVNPTATYAGTGNYNVTLTALSEFGCSGTITKPVTVEGNTTSFTVPDTVCLNSTVNFQNTSAPAPISSVWSFQNGQTSNLINDTTSYAAPGNYVVRLINTYANCTDSAFKTVVVADPPVVDFTGDILASCKVPLTVHFTDNSAGAVSWLWNFTGNKTSTLQNPDFIYVSEGQYNVTLTVTTARGCTNTLIKPNYIKVIKPAARIFNVPTGGCLPFTYTPSVTFSALDGIASYYWDYGDGTSGNVANPRAPHTYTDSGTYSIKFKVTSVGGCTDSTVINSAIRTGPPPVANFAVDTRDTCASSKVQFTDLSHPADKWFWEFGDGDTTSIQNPTHSYKDSGYFAVTLTAFNNGCKRSITIPQTVHIKAPVALFNYSIASCTNKTQVTFINQSKTDPAAPAPIYLWEFGDPTISNSNAVFPAPVTYPAIGTYKVVLTASNSVCTSTDTVVVQLVGDVADFTVSKPIVCKNDSFTVTTKSTNPQDIVRYEWSFDGGTTFVDSTTSFKLAFAVTGTYNIVLRITDINNCISTKTIPVTVNGPSANFTTNGTGGCGRSTITFNDLSTPAATIRKWTWNFGDGQTKTFTGAPFTHVYTDTGAFVIALTVEDNGGCTNSYTMPGTFTVTRPDISFSSNLKTICPGVDIQFKDSSTGSGLTYAWNFGDGTSTTDQNPIHRYSKPDSVYTVKLIITDYAGCRDSLVRTDYIKVRAPKPDFDIKDTTTICPPVETSFTFKGQDYESFYWDFGDGATSTLANTTHFYNDYGTFTAKLYLNGYGGCLDSTSRTVSVYDPYAYTVINYSPLSACNELMVNFDLVVPPSVKFNFDFSDGTFDSSQLKQFSHFYTSPGTYAPAINMKDNQNCPVRIGGRSTIRIIGAEPFFGVSKKSFCDSGTVFFTNYTIGNDPVVTRAWDFGDGTSNTTDTDPFHQYRQAGTYIAGQTVTTQAGCSKTITDTIRVYGTPHPLINADSVACINEAIAFRGTLVTPDTATAWLWDFGNGVGSSLQNASATYTKEGNYTAHLKATNLLGCFDTTSKNVFVPPVPIVTIPENPVIPVATGTALPVIYGPNIVSYAWTPPANLSCTDCAHPFASPRQTTTYTVKVTDIYGCQNTADVIVSVVCNEKNYFLPNTFSPNGDGVNDVFTPRGVGLARVANMRIFNRWGELVFEKKNFLANDRSPAGGWDGTYKGKPANPDVYVYIVEFICENAAIIPYKGNVTLIR